MKIFHMKEAIELGIEKEKKRRDFYGRVAEHFQEKELKELFVKLRDWEETHIEKFTEIKDSVAEPEPVQSYPGELAGYMEVLVGDKLYNDIEPADFANHVKTPQDAIQYGIGFEKDAILFFLELMGSLKQEKSREMIRGLIDEEKLHIVYLARLRQQYQKA